MPHVELLLTIMARYHLNVLHWRLANDTAWHIPIPSFHLLTGAGAQAPRPATDGHATSLRLGGGLAHPPQCAHGFYSEANIRHLVAYAAARDIRVIPEISFPPRTDAPIRAYPTMSNPGLVCSPTHTGETAPHPHTAPHRSSRRTSSTHDCRRPCQPNDYEESKPSSTQDHEFRPGLPPPTPPPPRHRRGRMAWIRHTTVEAALPSDRQRAHLPARHRSLLEDTAGISEGRAPIQTRGPVPPSGARSGAGMEPHPARLL
ncbi:family 20 glycosylhydrolase [Actinomyces sp.]